ncbi:glycosyltransferase family 2 protein [Pinibacter aurantiacus]|uniref:Glycosyltransferase n=1 Tax=Pinibacter aurantiacus TaxID=2851599 RepID=A0A9E2W1Q3_9BACT|nr:glycosyltransferase [Pinibacter aurantiacus]MBV4356370.1 glycosyltransferase [Pinibacter aurantiacus]
MPLVSVIIPTFNSSKYILKTLDAIFTQTLQDFEIIIVDDCSTDNTVDIIKAIGDPRIKLSVNESNKGISFTHNKLISLCTTNYIAIQDHDDISYPYRLKSQFEFLEKRKDLIAAASFPTYIDESGNDIMSPFFRKILRLLGLNNYNPSQEGISACMLFANIFCHSTVMINKKRLGDQRYSEDFKICDDYDLLARFAKNNAIKINRRPVLKYRIHRLNTSSKRFKEREHEVDIIQKKYLSLLNIHPSEEELYIHNGYFNRLEIFSPDIEYLHKTVNWYNKIESHNKEYKIYAKKELKEAISSNWFVRCFESKRLGMPVLKAYFKAKDESGKKIGKPGKGLLLLFAILLKRDLK